MLSSAASVGVKARLLIYDTKIWIICIDEGSADPVATAGQPVR